MKAEIQSWIPSVNWNVFSNASNLSYLFVLYYLFYFKRCLISDLSDDMFKSSIYKSFSFQKHQTELKLNFLIIFHKGSQGLEGRIGPPGPAGIGEPGITVSHWYVYWKWK